MLVRILVIFCLVTPIVSLAGDLQLAHGVRLDLSSCVDGLEDAAVAGSTHQSSGFCGDPQRYLVSEKLDGVRGYWDGNNLYTRNGNVIHAPKQFTQGWPSVPLDGELWIARGRFDQVSGIVRRKVPDVSAWRSVRFMVFDLHDSHASFEERLSQAQELIHQSSSSTIQLILQRSVASLSEIEEMLQSVVSQGGEGLMLHRKGAHYRAGRSDDILKLKPLWDAEALVVAHIPGKGKYQNMMGSLLVQGLSDVRSRGRQFKIGTGFTDQMRHSPPAIGSTVTYQFQGYTGTGLPRFARYLWTHEK